MHALPRPYAALAPMRRAATSRPELWRIALVCLLVFTFAAFGNGILFAAAMGAGIDVARMVGGQIHVGTTPAGLFVLFAGFAFLALGTVLVVQTVHDRPGRSLLGPGPALRREARASLFWVGAIVALALLLPAPFEGDVQPGQPAAAWLGWLPLALLGVAVQVSAEEMFFRGYLVPQLAARFASPAIWIGLPAAFFAINHYNPGTHGDMAWFVVLWAFLFGVIAGDLTARAGNIGPAIALHFVNNVLATVLVAMPGSMSGFALYLYPFAPDALSGQSGLLLVNLAMLGLFWLAVRIAIRR